MRETYTYKASPVTGINDNPATPGIAIFFIPAKDHFTVRIEEGATLKRPLRLTLYSILGEVITEREMREGEHEAVFHTLGMKHTIALLKVANSTFKVLIGQ